jgi:hypothetical protein
VDCGGGGAKGGSGKEGGGVFYEAGGKAKGEGWMRFLRNAPKVKAEAGDEIT